MALPSTGSISMEQVRTELKRTGAISLNDPDVRKLAGKPNGIISMNDLRGKSLEILIHKTILFSETSQKNNYPSEVHWEENHNLNMPKQKFKNGYIIFVQGQSSYHIWDTYADIYKNNGEKLCSLDINDLQVSENSLFIGHKIFVGDSSDSSIFPLKLKCYGELVDFDEYGVPQPVFYDVVLHLEADFLE